MARPINEQLRQARSEDILSAAREILAQEGAVGFSLRAVARRLDLSPNALYNYYPCLSDLVTALLVDAFGRFANALQSAAKEVQPDNNHRQRFVRLCLAYREWIVHNPIDYDLMFGRPIPGYHAPAEVTGPLSQQAFDVGLQILVDAWQAGQLRLPERYAQIPASIVPQLAAQGNMFGVTVPLAVRYLMLVAWTRLHGMVSLEIHGNADEAIGDLAAFFAHNLNCLSDEIGLSS